MRVVASQKLPRDSGESIFAARQQDVSQGLLGKQKSPEIFGRERCLVRFPPHIRFAPPHIMAQYVGAVSGREGSCYQYCHQYSYQYSYQPPVYCYQNYYGVLPSALPVMTFFVNNPLVYPAKSNISSQNHVSTRNCDDARPTKLIVCVDAS